MEKLYSCLTVTDDARGKLRSLWTSLSPLSEGSPSPYTHLVKSLAFHNVASSINFPQHATNAIASLSSMPELSRIRFSSSRTDAWDLVWNCTRLLVALSSSPSLSTLRTLEIDGARFNGTVLAGFISKFPLKVLEMKRTDGQLRSGIQQLLSNGLEELSVVDAFKTLYYAFDDLEEEELRLKVLRVGEYRKWPDDGLRKVIGKSQLEELELDVFKVSVSCYRGLDTRL